jgi:peroxiredoxin
MSLPESRLCLLLAAAGLAAGAARAADEDAGSVPRYRLKVGQELNYRQTSEFKYGKGASAGTLGSRADWEVWVVRQNDDGSWRLVMRSSHSDWQGKDPRFARPSLHLTHCDLFPDGRLAAHDTAVHAPEAAALFPRLPKDAAEAGKGWEDRRPRDDIHCRFSIVGADRGDPNLLIFDEVRDSPLDPIYLSSSRTRFWFDRKRGLVHHATGNNSQGYGFEGKGTGYLELRGVKEKDAAWVKQLAAESDRFFAAHKRYNDLLTKAAKDGKDVGALLKQAEAVLAEMRTGATLPLFKEQVDELEKTHKQMAEGLTGEAKRRAEVVGKPAPPWELKDLGGKTHKLADYKGKVVVLDFWYRGCGWCMKAMPQVNQLAADFQGQPVAVLAMCTDPDEKDARLVADKMKLTYPVLRAQGVPEKYKVQGFPTLIVIDPEGTVREFHVGYSPTLRDDVAKVIRGLLTKK